MHQSKEILTLKKIAGMFYSNYLIDELSKHLTRGQAGPLVLKLANDMINCNTCSVPPKGRMPRMDVCSCARRRNGIHLIHLLHEWVTSCIWQSTKTV